MGLNISGFGTAAPNATFWIGYHYFGETDHGAQFAQAKPEGAAMDGTEDGSFVCTGHEIHLEVNAQRIGYSFWAQNTSAQYLSFMLCSVP